MMPATYLYVDSYLDTIRLIENLDIDLFTSCHWPMARGQEIATFCAESRNLVEQAERLLLEATVEAGDGGISMRELCEQVGPALGDWPQAANIECAYMFSGHLSRMQGFGLIEQANKGSTPCLYKAL